MEASGQAVDFLTAMVVVRGSSILVVPFITNLDFARGVVNFPSIAGIPPYMGPLVHTTKDLKLFTLPHIDTFD